MAFCPYCGKQLEAGEICACTAGAPQQPAPSYIGAPRTAGPAAPGSAEPRPAAAGAEVQRPAAPRPAAPRPAAPEAYPSYEAAPQQNAYTAAPEEPARPRESYQLTREGYQPPREDRQYAPRRENDYFDAQSEYRASRVEPAPAPAVQDEYYAQRGDDFAPAAPTATVGFVHDLKELLTRLPELFSGKADEVLRASVDCEGTSWLAVFGAYILFGTLAACFAVPRFIANVAGDLIQSILGSFGSGAIKYADVLSASFGGMLWRSLLINLFAVGIVIAAAAIVCKVNKAQMPMSGVLNLVGLAFVPAAVLNVLGFLLSFFFPAGALLCGIVSAVCTVVMVLSAVSDYCGKRSLWTNIITVCAVIAVYALLVWLFMSGFTNSLLAPATPSFGGLW